MESETVEQLLKSLGDLIGVYSGKEDISSLKRDYILEFISIALELVSPSIKDHTERREAFIDSLHFIVSTYPKETGIFKKILPRSGSYYSGWLKAMKLALRLISYENISQDKRLIEFYQSFLTIRFYIELVDNKKFRRLCKEKGAGYGITMLYNPDVIKGIIDKQGSKINTSNCT